jgi:DNA-binding MarR family transcriptional regulator
MLTVPKIKPRQLEVMRRIALGQKSTEIAKAIGISPSTVRKITRQPESREYLALYLELLDLISEMAQANQTLEALQAHRGLLSQGGDLKELIEFSRDLLARTGKEEFLEILIRLKRAANHNTPLQVAK